MPRAQPGEGIVVVLDVGPGVRAGTDTTFLIQSKKCLINILQRKMYAEKCRDVVGIVLCGSDETDNDLASGSQYQNIKVLQRPCTVTWDIINEVEQLSGGRESGDWLDSLVIAMDLLHDPDDNLYSTKKIVLMTDFSGEFSDDQTTTIIAGLKNHGIELSVIGPEIISDEDENGDADDDIDGPGPSNGVKREKNGKISVTQNWNGKPKSPIQLAGEALITRIVSEADGIICSFDEAIPQLLFFQKRSSNSGNWNTLLDIGPNLQIAITGRIKVKHATAPTWKRMHAHDENAVFIKETSYHRNDDAQTAVNEDEVIPGYRYGSTLVPFSDEDAQMQYSSESPRSLSMLGFTRRANVSHQVRAGDQVLVVTAREGDEAGAVALSAFIQALVELDYVGITRRIYNKNNNPVLGVLFPEITKNYECLIWIPLPFQEDVRLYTFPSLKRTIDKLTESEAQAMDDLISAMDLTSKDEDDDDELLEPSTVLNPQLQHYFNVLTHRAVHEHDPLPPPEKHVTSILEPPEEVIEARDTCAAGLTSLFPTKKLSKKREKEDVFGSKEDESNKKLKQEEEDAESAGDVSLTLVTKVTSATPVQDFNALLRGEAPNFSLICSQMGEVILQLVDSVGGGRPANEDILAKIVDCLTAYRQEACIIDPSTYNKFMVNLKDAVTSRSLRNLWDRVKEGNLGQINTEESLKSNINVEASRKFFDLEEQPQQAAPEPKPENVDDVDDLLDDL